MKNIFCLPVILLFVISCGGKARQEQAVHQNKVKDTVKTAVPADPQVAVNFLNEYIRNSGIGTADWLKHCGLVTDNYIARYIAAENGQKKTLESGGEPGDLVTGNMDWCETGYQLKKFDAQTGYVLASGNSEISGCDENIDPVIVKIIQVGNKWLVDGSGSINIPDGAYETFR